MNASSNTIRYRTLAGTVLTQFALGSVYTWSLFNAQLSAKLSEPVSQVAFAFGLLSLALAVASSLAGKLQERFGVQRVTLGAGLMLGLGFFLTAQANNLVMLYLCAGVLVGLADGAGYLLTLSNCVKWFPERKGLVSACAIGAYGLGSLGFKYINLALLARFSLETTFELWGLIAMIMVVAGSLLMRDAPQQQAAAQQSTSHDYTLAEAMRQPQYWMLALMFLTVCMSGLYVIGVAKDIGESYVHLPTLTAANAVAVIAVANLSGRLVLGILSDKMPRIRVITIAQVSALAGMLTLLFVPLNATLFFLAIACVAFSFGGTITVYPSLVSDFFGLNNLTKNYGVIYLGFGIGSIVGSIVASLFGGFLATFHLILALLIVALLFSLTIRQPGTTKDEEFEAEPHLGKA
ncbi:MFS transporter [Chromobacterium haemolyticum]|uniref:MFS transporter n=1 Tax=Chromobacterium haemolyticum TaxID=394935 RepID=A0ABS3GS34_9NEIS|nr:MFS transporter [Chromobacterium haemolyticum]MBK0416674.1 MFS transporter [Chromobacterium haemolyticum]MBO0417869.1 MFS transporter [Chromobacterium haemolyticum]MBO0501033.1 MFS transporter [Chromobacterium haemolyticum]